MASLLPYSKQTSFWAYVHEAKTIYEAYTIGANMQRYAYTSLCDFGLDGTLDDLEPDNGSPF